MTEPTRAWSDALTLARTPLKTVRLQSVPALAPPGRTEAAAHRTLEGAGAEFRLLEVVGRGGMGIVHQAVQRSLERLVAVKRVRPELGGDPEWTGRFLREAELTGRLEHPNIIPVHDLGQDEQGRLFYTMKLVTGRPWSEGLRDHSLDVNLGLLARVMDAVAFAHAQGVVHRDLKPANVMLGGFGEVYVVDWGLAAALPAPGGVLEDPATVGGTPAYMAPEIASGRGPAVAPAVDIYLLGAILFELLTFEPPHPGDTASEGYQNAAWNVIRKTPVRGELMELALRAMATEPEDRFPSVHAFQEAILDYKSHAQSNALANLAAEAARGAAVDGAHGTYQGAVFGFKEALRLWPGNRNAREALVQVQGDYARTACARGDLDLAATLLDPAEPSHQALLLQVAAARKLRRRRQTRLKILTVGSLALVAALLVTLATAVVLVRAEKERVLIAHRAEAGQLLLAERAHYGLGLAQALTLFEEGKGARALELLQSLPLSPRGWELSLLESRIQAATGVPQFVFRGQGDRVYALAVSPDGRRVASGCEGGKALLWDTAAGQILKTYDAGGSALAFSPDNLMLALGDGSVWMPHKKVLLFKLPGVTDELAALVFSPDGRFLAGADWGGGIRLWRVPGGALAGQLKEGSGPVTRVAFAPDSRSLLWGAKDGRVHTARVLPSGALAEGAPLQALPAPVLSVAWSRDGTLAAGARDGTVRLWPAAGKPLTFTSQGGGVPSLSFSPDGKLLAGGSLDGVVRVWEAASGKPALELKGHQGMVIPCAFAADGRLVSGSHDGTVRLWRLPAREEAATPALRPAALKYLDGSRLLVGREDGSLALLHRYRGEVLWTTRAVPGAAKLLAVDARGGRLYSAGTDGVIRRWEAYTGRMLSDYPGDGTETQALAVAGDLLASAGKDLSVTVRSAATGALVRKLDGLEDWAGALDFSPDGRYLAAATVAGGLRVWEVRTWQEVFREKGVEGRYMNPVTLAFGPADGRLAVGAWDKGIEILNTLTWKKLSHLEGQTGWGRGAWTRDGRRVTAASLDGKFRVWDALTGSLLLTLPMPPGQTLAMAMAPDGRSVALGGQTLTLWEAE